MSSLRTPRKPSGKPALSGLLPQRFDGDSELKQLTIKDLERITNPTLPGGGGVTPPLPTSISASSLVGSGAVKQTPREAKRAQQDFELRHDALLIVEQKAPNVFKMPSLQDSNINRYLHTGDRQEALRTLPLAFPPVRFRRGETIDEYIESVTTAWEEVRRNSASPMLARRASASGGQALAAESKMHDAMSNKNESLRKRHLHVVSRLWRQTHATKADIISSDETSRSLLQPLLESGTQAAITCEEAMVSAMATNCRDGVHATPKGLVVPYQYFESLLQTVQSAIDSAFWDFFQFAQDEDTVRQQAEEDVTERKLNQLIKGNNTRGPKVKAPLALRAAVDLPPIGHPSRHSWVTVKTAVHVAVLWRMLEQVKSIVPGMDTALRIFEEGILPLLYVDFVDATTVMPHVSSLAEQVKQICSLPLVCVQLQIAEANSSQYRHDLEYLRKAMENWGFTIWRNYNSVERRRSKHLDCLEKWFQRLQCRGKVATFFYQWRFHVIHEKSKVAEASMKEKFDVFVQRAKHAAAEHLPMSMNRAIAANQARFHAQKLAATALHVRRPRRDGSTSPTREQSPSVLRAGSSRVAVPPQPPRGVTSPSAELSSVLPSSSAVLSPSVSRGAVSPIGQAPPLPTTDDVTSAELSPSESPTQRQNHSEAKFFDEVMGKLQSVEDVSGHLREYIAIQRQSIDKMEADRRHQHNLLVKAQSEAMKLMEENLKWKNIVQERDLKIRDQLRQILRLKSKVRLHRHRHWRRVGMKILSNVLQTSNSMADDLDAAKFLMDANSGQTRADALAKATAANSMRPMAASGITRLQDFDDGGDETDTELGDPTFAEQVRRPTEHERMYARYAPLVLDAPSQLPDALVVLRDWANNCLSDLHALDGVGSASISTRFTTLTTEIRDGIILSRLLFYLALPRYQCPRRSEELEDVSPDFNVNRARLLMGKNVQLHSPFPTYDDCFGDLPRYPPAARMNILLNFASDMISGTLRLTDDQLIALDELQDITEKAAIEREEKRQIEIAVAGGDVTAAAALGGFRRSSFSTGSRDSSATKAFAMPSAGSVILDNESESSASGHSNSRKKSIAFGNNEDLSAAYPVSSEFLQQYVDPLLLIEGSKTAVVTLLALLYVRFSHPFLHKANETIAWENDLMKTLLKDPVMMSKESASEVASAPEGSPVAVGRRASLAARIQPATPSTSSPIKPSDTLNHLLSALEEEEKSPWQLFLERCKPAVCSVAQTFLLDGNFWSGTMIESPEMMEVFAAVAAALQRSLETHRWHITLMCLTPMISSIGVSRGCFSGMFASTSLFLYQRQVNMEVLEISPQSVHSMLTQRKELHRAPDRPLSPNDTSLISAQVQRSSSQQNLAGTNSPPTSPPEGSLSHGKSPRSAVVDDLDEFCKSSQYLAIDHAVRAYLTDLARIFLSRSSVNQTMLVPTMTLTAWRLMWMDAGVCPEKLTVDTVTFIFSEACQSSSSVDAASRSASMSMAAESMRAASIKSTGSDGAARVAAAAAAAVANQGPASLSGPVEMNLEAFCEGVLRVAHYRFAPVTTVTNATPPLQNDSSLPFGSVPPVLSPTSASSLTPRAPPLSHFPSQSRVTSSSVSSSANKRKVYTTLAEAFKRLMVEYVLPLYPSHTPTQAIARIKQGVQVEDLLRRKNAELAAVFQAYSRIHLGITALEKDDALRLVKDAGIATAELSYQVVSDLFQECSFKRTAADVAVANTQDPNSIDGPGSVNSGLRSSVFASAADGRASSAFLAAAPVATGRRMGRSGTAVATDGTVQSHMQQAMGDKHLLDFPAFVDFLCVLTLYKLPNPFVAMHVRLENFLERSVIGPLRFRVEQTARARARRKETTVSLNAPASQAQSAVPSGANTNAKNTPVNKSLQTNPRSAAR